MKRTKSQVLFDIVLGLGAFACMGGAVYKIIDGNAKRQFAVPNSDNLHNANSEMYEGGALGIAEYAFGTALIIFQERRKRVHLSQPVQLTTSS